MSVKITTTSTADLPQVLLDRYDITVIPLYVSFGGNTYRDGVDAGPADIFRHVESGGELPTTSAVNLLDYQKLFQALSPQYDAVVHIPIGAEFSCTCQNAVAAAADFPNVYVADSCNLTVGQGLLVLEAAEAAARGATGPEIVELVKERAPKVDTTFVVDTLDYLVKGGRVPSLVALGANLLHLKPCIELQNGKMGVGKKYRGTFEKALADYVRDALKRDDLDLRRAFVVHSRCDEALPKHFLQVLRDRGFQEVYEAVAGSTISCHCGPNTLGVIFMRR